MAGIVPYPPITRVLIVTHLAVGQNQWYHFWVGAPPILVYFSGDWDVHWGYGNFTHGHFGSTKAVVQVCGSHTPFWSCQVVQVCARIPMIVVVIMGRSPTITTVIGTCHITDSALLNPGPFWAWVQNTNQHDSPVSRNLWLDHTPCLFLLSAPA